MYSTQQKDAIDRYTRLIREADDMISAEQGDQLTDALYAILLTAAHLHAQARELGVADRQLAVAENSVS